MLVKMGKEIKLWIGKTLNGDELVERAGTLKTLCGKIGISYNTAKKRQDVSGGVTVWLVGDKVAWEVWVERVKR